MTTAALVLGAGRGERLGGAIPKAFVTLCGVPLILRSLRILDSVKSETGLPVLTDVHEVHQIGAVARADSVPLLVLASSESVLNNIILLHSILPVT